MSSKVWLVTGSSSGIGRGAVELALSRGDKVIATLRKPEVLAELTKQYTSDKLLVLKLDTTNNEEVKSVFKTGREHFGRVDIVYSNAGVGINAEVESTPEEDCQAIISTNFWGSRNVAVAAVETFRDFNKPQGGRLIHISSYLGAKPLPGGGWYCAAKAATEILLETLYQELDPDWNIKLNILCPGFVMTPMTINPRAPEKHPAYRDNKKLPSQQSRGLTFYSLSGLNKIIYDVSKDPNAPLRIVLGKDAVDGYVQRAEEFKKAAADGEVWSKDMTLFDGQLPYYT